MQWRLHKLMYRLSNGRIGSRAIGMPVLSLTTTGRKSGEPRQVLLTYVDHPDGWIVAATNAGAGHDPAWSRNLDADPRAIVAVGGTSSAVTARRLEDEERSQAWEALTTAYDGYETYRDAADRSIPVVLLQSTS